MRSPRITTRRWRWGSPSLASRRSTTRRSACGGSRSGSPRQKWPVRTVLDFGCGTGSGVPYLFDGLGAKLVHGVDVSAASLETARKVHKRDGTTFALIEEPIGPTFDLATCNGVFHHIPVAERHAGGGVRARRAGAGRILRALGEQPVESGDALHHEPRAVRQRRDHADAAGDAQDCCAMRASTSCARTFCSCFRVCCARCGRSSACSRPSRSADSISCSRESGELSAQPPALAGARTMTDTNALLVLLLAALLGRFITLPTLRRARRRAC